MCLCVLVCVAIVCGHGVWVCGCVDLSPRSVFVFCYKNASRLNSYNFTTVNAIDFPFSTLYPTPFLSGKIHFGVLH